MYRFLQRAVLILLFPLISFSSYSQDYTFEDFVGTWHGTINSSCTWSNNYPMTMVIHSDGFYTETSGCLMPTTYPNTQQCDYEASTNRFHWWYLYIVYAGQQTYQHHYYTVVHFQNDTLIMHYNFWNDPEPHPQIGTIFLVRENSTPPPTNLLPNFINNEVQLTWEAPENGGNPIPELQGYNVYESYASGDYELLAFTADNFYLIEDTTFAGLYAYYATAVYDEGESLPSDELYIIYTTPEPENLQGNPQANSITLEWVEPDPESSPMATLLGYNIYHQYENGSFGFVDFTESGNYIIAQGAHASMMFLANIVREALPNGHFSQFSEAQEAWIIGRFTKICLQVPDEATLLAIYEEARKAGLESNLVTDAGLTEFGGVPTNTCLAIGPDEADKIDMVTGKLQLY